MKYIPDSSAIINGTFLKYIVEQKDVDEIILSRVVLAEVEHMANQAKTIGLTALDELKELKLHCAKNGITLVIDGDRPSNNDIKYAPMGTLDSLIRVLAEEYQGILVTSDRIQAEMGEMEGLAVVFLKETSPSELKKIEDFFTDKTMSVHLRENNPPLAKKGTPGNFELVTIENEILTKDLLEEIAKDIMERAIWDKDSFIEIDHKGATVIQLRNMRIIILRPPFSDANEITAVRPILKMKMDDYTLDQKLLKRIEERADGIIIAGAPGAGKSTFATALAEFYADKEKIVKTFENPRDLQVDERITQLGGVHGDIGESADLVLLMRPDYVVFDELRKTRDFETYADLRLAGIGLVGVLHATEAIDGIQRFIKRVDLGVIPSIVDTVIFIAKGNVEKALTLELTVKVPTGMQEKDLSRPVIEVRDFDTNKLEYEIYSFGEQIVVAPVRKKQKTTKYSPPSISAYDIQKVMNKYSIDQYQYSFDPPNTLILYVKEKDKPMVIGREGRTISKIERDLGDIRIDVKTFKEMSDLHQEEAEFILDVYETKKHIVLVFPSICMGKDVQILINGESLAQLTVGQSSDIKLRKNTDLGEILTEAYRSGSVISALM